MVEFEYRRLCEELAGKTVEFSGSFKEIYLILASLDFMLVSPQVQDYGDLFETFAHGVIKVLLQGLRDLGLTEEQVASLAEFSRMEDDEGILRDGSHLSIVVCEEEDG